ncbi:hypothetical protein H181DRAFT_01056 [Streptomyces sp. WMMB 714]|jgi:hypothetical protein|uniref:hypothetical protein n=1 Tax=Streptomyces sp. WMMB 714 TaxID=1286822 RepID=UPI000698BF9A|nr:hypothetical protein [Streptomyces sp. WMMB 714]SCK15648.1 hypothetical protein H181DRAFT_01056 [Streptomyces sp. WMMB 714]
MTSGDAAPGSPEDSAAGGRSGEQAAEAAGGSVHIGSMSGGAIATGRYGQATSHTYAAPPPQTDEATRAVLDAVRDLRRQMEVFAASDETRDVGGELDRIEGEITRTGRADRGRLERLRERLESGSTAVGALASAATVVQAVAGVLG